MGNKEKQKQEDVFPRELGQYTLTRLIGKGGMGEIFLADDPVCKRTIALKRILPVHMAKEILRKRFLNEPRIAAKLSHPSIIPVYALHEAEDTIYYTMPYIDGETLREILIKTRVNIERGRSPHPIGSSIQTLMLMFINMCNAIEYTHSKGYLHRDIKPENIIVGTFNEVVILDWGVATKIESIEEEEEDITTLRGLTRPGKTVGTVEFMAPERALGAGSSVLTDIYSLGATLHFMLTLRIPFNRPTSLKEWRKQLNEMGTEKLTDPQEISPYREITPELSRITMKCLNQNPSKRYQNVREIIADMQRYIQGRPQWIPITDFQINKASDWEFQENIHLSKQMAISRYAGISEWVMLMLSREAYSGNIQLKTSVKLRDSCVGLGFLMCVPEASERKGLESGYLVWIGSKIHPGAKLLRSNVEVINLEKVHLEPEQCYSISLERQGNVFRLFIDEKLILSYTSHIPLVGGHFGLLFKDTDFDMDPLTLLSGSQNVLVNCLSVPDALLMNKYFARALAEYRLIAHSFKGRSEGREATFRAGITLIEQGKEYYDAALSEFEKLHNTPGAPIEYLGKSLVYRASGALDKEAECLESALKLFPIHPLKFVLEEHIMFRLHESARTDRRAAYTFTLLTIRYLPKIYEKSEAQTLIKNLTVSWETIPFIEVPANLSEEDASHIRLPQQLAFWLGKPQILYELALEIPETSKQRVILLENSLAALLALRCPSLITSILNDETPPEFLATKNIFSTLLGESSLEEKVALLIAKVKPKIFLAFLLNELTAKNAPILIPHLQKSPVYKPELIWALLLAGKKEEAGKLLKNEAVSDPSSPYYVLQGCYLASTQGEKQALSHFESLHEDPFPPISTLLGHFLNGNIDLKGAFLWEKVQLFRQLVLYYTCLKQPHKAAHYKGMIVFDE